MEKSVKETIEAQQRVPPIAPELLHKALEEFAAFQKILPEVVKTVNTIKSRTEENEKTIAALGASQATTQKEVEEVKNEASKLDYLLDMVTNINEQVKSNQANQGLANLASTLHLLGMAGGSAPTPSSAAPAAPTPSSAAPAAPYSLSPAFAGPSTSSTRQQPVSASASTGRPPIRTYGRQHHAQPQSNTDDWLGNTAEFADLFRPSATSLSSAMSSVSIHGPAPQSASTGLAPAFAGQSTSSTTGGQQTTAQDEDNDNEEPAAAE